MQKSKDKVKERKSYEFSSTISNYYGSTNVYLRLYTVKHVPEGTCKDPEARLDAAVIALKTEQVQFHMPLFPKADCEFLSPSKHSKNWSTLPRYHLQNNRKDFRTVSN